MASYQMYNKKGHYHNFKQVLVYQIFKYFPEAITSVWQSAVEVELVIVTVWIATSEDMDLLLFCKSSACCFAEFLLKMICYPP